MSLLLVYLLCITLNFSCNTIYAQDAETEVEYTEEQTPEQDEAIVAETETGDMVEDGMSADNASVDNTGVDDTNVDETSFDDMNVDNTSVDEDSLDTPQDDSDDGTSEQEGLVSDDADATLQDETEDVVEEIEEVVEPEPEGIDTVDINEPEGNWLFKRIWWEKSKDLFGKIRDRVDKIVESRMHFFQERVRLDRELLDPFYVEIGLDRGALQASVDNLLGILKSEREKDGTLDTEELDTYNKLVEGKVTLEKLGESVESVQQLDASLDEALNKLMEQINLARSYEREAWRLLNEIAEELSDKKAREHYYAIATLWRNVKEISNYIEGAFGQHFLQVSKMSIQNVQNINQAIADLEQKGIGIKASVEAKQEEVTTPDDDEDDDDLYAPKQETGWFAWLWQTLTGWFSW